MSVRRRLRPLLVVALTAALSLPAGAATAGPADRDVTVYVAGDSTAATYAWHEAPRAGWGQALGEFLRDEVDVVNLAWSGASSRSFAEAGLLNRILDRIQPGDVLLISFGHNDSKTDDRGTDPYTTYQSTLLRYVDGARARGAQPVLVTPVERRRFTDTGAVRTSHGEYPEAMRQLAQREDVPLVDLTALSLERWAELGPNGTTGEFLHLAPGERPNYPDGVADNTHFGARGAIELARLVVGDLKDQRVLRPWQARGLRAKVADSDLEWPAERPAGPEIW
ncbi:rhamnogalacturonan acetylesterase [Cellulomonas sp. ATA003]|uniref:rhamnogalacturonan acetylesterase n=1 Tax=Cellulomonas sp. ATA003 TaxID=3073064 RepID=UPI002873BA85|nr:rhamnogalacturonan acetylesterase [Cellulomonas sp. ATA003]WNB85638.1 rhamnogalacturonan acetylesterase [Cellulomonas sp. ATA003]